MQLAAKQTDMRLNEGVQSIVSPQELKQQLGIQQSLAMQIEQQRQQLRDALHGQDKRFIVIVGPCSIHDEQAALDYGQRLAELSQQLSDKLHIVMRAYVEKPRTTVGWKGFAYDPQRNGLGDMAQGLSRSRKLMLQLAELGLPLATEALNPLVMNYFDDLVSWVAIGARTAESQTHREMVSHLSMPVGIKNSTDGSADNAINAMISAASRHHTLGVDAQGQLAMLTTPGNKDTHLVLRGGHGVTNYDEQSIASALRRLHAAQQHAKVLVDCSHANSCKNHERQIAIADNVAEQYLQGNDGILGIMLESFIEAGRQDEGDNLRYGCSITDACISWEQTESLLQDIYRKLS